MATCKRPKAYFAARRRGSHARCRDCRASSAAQDEEGRDVCRGGARTTFPREVTCVSTKAASERGRGGGRARLQAAHPLVSLQAGVVVAGASRRLARAGFAGRGPSSFPPRIYEPPNSQPRCTKRVEATCARIAAMHRVPFHVHTRVSSPRPRQHVEGLPAGRAGFHRDLRGRSRCKVGK